MGHVWKSDLSCVSPLVKPNSFALLSDAETTDTAAVFVHGFNGHPRRTWGDAWKLISKDPGWKNIDAFFLGYESVTSDLASGAAHVRHFLSHLCAGPPTALLAHGSIQLRDPVAYSKLILVGHSAGGVVVRRAVLDALKHQGNAAETDPHLMLLANLRLFAPAIGGARLSGLIGLLTAVPGLRTGLAVARGASPSFQELMQDSMLLRGLADQTTASANTHPQLPSLRAKVVWASNDAVVSAVDYLHDVGWMVLDETHTGICKVTSTKPQPLTFVLSGSLAGEGGVV